MAASNRAISFTFTTNDQQAIASLKRMEKGFKGLDVEVDRTRRSSSSLGDTLGNVAGPAVYAAGLYKAAQAASNLAESQSKVVQVFGESDAISKFAEDAAQSIGQSEQQALDAIGTFGNLLTAFGVTGAEAQSMSMDFTQLASDLASFNNTSVQDAIEALRSGLSGESEPLKRYGVALNEARIKQEALALGIYDGVGALTAAEKAQATYSIVMKDTAKAQGDFERTSEGAANQSRIAKAEFDNAAASLGDNLLPAMTAAAGAAGDLAKFVGALPKPVQLAVLALGGLALVGPRVAAGLALVRTTSVAAATGLTTFTTSATAATAEGAALQTQMSGLKFGILGMVAAVNRLHDVTSGDVIDVTPKFIAKDVLDSSLADVRQWVADMRAEMGPEKFEAFLKQVGKDNPDALYRMRKAMGDTYDEASPLGHAIEWLRGQLHKKREATDEDTSATDANREAADRWSAAVAKNVDDEIKLHQAQLDLVDSKQAVTDAQEELTDAQQAAVGNSDEYRTAQAAVVDAEQSVVDAQEASRRAQEGLTQARKDAAESLEDMRFAAEGAALSEERAKLRLDDAKKKQEEVNRSQKSTARDRKDAALDVAEADLALREAQDRRGDSATALAEADAKGVEGSPQVVAAKQAIADAADAQRAAEKNLADATDAASQVLIDAKAKVADASKNLRNAQEKERLKAREVETQIYGTAAANDHYIGKLQAQADELGPNGPLRKNLDAYIDRLKLIQALTDYSGPALPGAQQVVPPTRDPDKGAGSARLLAPQVTMNVRTMNVGGSKRDLEAAAARASSELARKVAAN